MVEPFKNFFNPDVISQMAGHLHHQMHGFSREEFVAFCVKDLEDLELKQRSNRIVEGLEKYLPCDFEQAAKILVDSLDPNTDLAIDSGGENYQASGIRGWAIMPMADYVALRGQNHPETALETLRQLTMRWSAEFAIRPFLMSHFAITLKTMNVWIKDPNPHVRRLVSEGTRPRLPWGMRLHQFIKDPAPTLKLLEKLKDDPSEYVRRSVANHLNDIAKDHPDLVARIAGEWMVDASKDRQRLVRHALRSLIKQGHGGALEALGYGPANVELVTFELGSDQVELGEVLELNLKIRSISKQDQPLIVDFVVHHCLANGKTSPKVFKWRNVDLRAQEQISFSKCHPIKPITTRKYYAGVHRIEVMINGVSLCERKFDLVV